MGEMTPREIVEMLDRHIVGQQAAKRAIAVAIRNRWRWKRLPPELRKEITPKNIIMIGPTGVGKTEITRRLAKLTGAPFIKVEATKYTEVGYHGRDVESMARDLVDAAATLVRARTRGEIEGQVAERVEDNLLDLLAPESAVDEAVGNVDDQRKAEKRRQRTRAKLRERLRAGELDDRYVDLHIEPRAPIVQVLSHMGYEQMDLDFRNVFERLLPRQVRERRVKVAEARQILVEQQIEDLLDKDVISEEAIALAEDSGIIFIDEIDKICGSDGSSHNIEVSRQGVQRDLLPMVEGTIVQTRHGPVSTEHVLFIAAGAFHSSKPSDLMPELQGRFPLRVELQDLTRDDFVRILSEPSSSLPNQYQALLAADGVALNFTPDALEAVADIAFQVNQSTQNIGARRLYTIIERLLEDLSFTAPSPDAAEVTIDATYVRRKLDSITQDDDLSRFIL